MRTALVLVIVLVPAVFAGCFGTPATSIDEAVNAASDPHYLPRAIVGIPDVGINPYHALFYRPELTEHPCTYIRDFPCDVKELRLTVGGGDWEAAFAADEATWLSLERGAWYWIPQTSFVAVRCDVETWDARGNGIPREDICILDEVDGPNFPGHGTGTTSIVAMQDPEAMLAFNEGGYDGIQPFFDADIPVDVFSVSMGGYIPRPRPHWGPIGCPFPFVAPLVFYAAGNFALPIPLDCGLGDLRIITVGGGDAVSRSHYLLSGNAVDIESYFCPPYAAPDSVTEVRVAGSLCGTSFAAPSAAAGMSRVVRELRRASGYDGGLTPEGLVDPILGLSVADLRDAMNLTATYTPAPRYPTEPTALIFHNATRAPVNPAAPWLQWGWGFYDGDVANATLAHLLGTSPAPAKPDAATAYMATMADLRRTLYG